MADADERDPKHSEDVSSWANSEDAEDQQLLQEWKLEEDAGESPKSSQWIRRWVLRWPIIVGTIVLLAAFIVAGYLLTRTDESLGGVQTNDYVLNSRWNVQSPPQRREFHWTIKDHVFNPDGIFRPMILVNNQFPGPLI